MQIIVLSLLHYCVQQFGGFLLKNICLIQNDCQQNKIIKKKINQNFVSRVNIQHLIMIIIILNTFRKVQAKILRNIKSVIIYKMLANPNPYFEALINQLLIDKRYELALKEGERRYQIRQFNVVSITPIEVTSMYYHISTKFYEKDKTCESESWFENQLRVFIWLLVGHSYLEGQDISKMTLDDWQLFSKIFNGRNCDIFQFQAFSILKRERKCLKWSSDESTLLNDIIKNKQIKNKWNQIARELYINSDKLYFRTAKQCRQHWINHLDPLTLRTNWTLQEDYELINSVLIWGKKWSKISKKFGGKRTEHMIKNRFKSLLHFEKKKIQKQKIQLSQRKMVESLLENLKQDLSNSSGDRRNKKDKNQPKIQFFRDKYEIQSAEKNHEIDEDPKIFREKEGHCDIKAARFMQRDEDIFRLNSQENISPKSIKQDFSIFIQSEKDHPSIFHDCLNLFMGQDFKRDHFPYS